jgi:hypothetical protein
VYGMGNPKQRAHQTMQFQRCKKYWQAAYKCLLPTDDETPQFLKSVPDVGQLRKGFVRFVDVVLGGGGVCLGVVVSPR